MMKVKLSSKTFLFLFFIVALPTFLFSQQSYDITFKIGEIYVDTVVIKSYYGNKTIVIDSLKREKDGSFRLKKDNIHKGIGIFTVGKMDIFTFVFDKENKFEINLDDNWNYMIKGCQENDLYFEFQKANKQIRFLESKTKREIKENPKANRDSLNNIYSTEVNKFMSFQKEFYKSYPNHIMTKMVKALEDPQIPKEYLNGNQIDSTKKLDFIYYFRTHYWDNFDFSDNRLIATPYFFTKQKTYMNELTMQSADSIAVAIKDFIEKANQKNGLEYSKYILDYYIQMNRKLPFAYNEERFVEIVDRVVSGERTPWISPSEIETLKIEADKIRPLLPEKQFINISEKDLSGKTYNLYDIKKKYTVVYFWSAGCESCKINLDQLETFYKKFKNVYDFEIFSIDLDNNMEESIAFQQKHPFDWIVLKSNSTLLKEKYNLDIEMTPDLYLLDKDKKIINHTPLYNQIEETIKSIEEEE
jgi:peroxiredoxin